MQSFLCKKVEISTRSTAARWLTLALVAAVVGPGSVYALSRRAVSQPTAMEQRLDQGLVNAATDRVVVVPEGSPVVSAALPIGDLASQTPTPTASPTPTAFPSPTATITRTSVLTTHVVHTGETVSALAQKYQVSEDTIRWANNLDGSSLQNDQQLLIPPVSGVVHTVKGEEKIADLAALYRVDAQAIVSANNLTNAGALEGGSLLVIPGGRPLDAARGNAAARGDRQREAATDRSGATSYEVMPGDTLSGIAAKFDVTVSTIANANSIPDPDHLTAGQKLVIPAALGVLHTVQDGDNVDWIASRYGVTVEGIVAANKLTSPELIKPGDRILIPSPDVTPGNIPTATPTPDQKTTPADYTVQPGDTLLAIAYQLGIDADQIAKANSLAEPFVLRAGQVLQVPGAGGQQSAGGGTVAAPAKTIKRVVVAGDTVFGLSVSTKVPADIIISMNNLQSPYNLQVGQELVIPAVSGDELAATTGSGAQPAPASAPPEPQPSPTSSPTAVLTAVPTAVPTVVPTAVPAVVPSVVATAVPTALVTSAPTARPTSVPTARPTKTPIPSPTPKRTATPVPVPVAPVTGASPLGARVVELALQYRGFRYTWGGSSPTTGFDCSGFVYYIYKQAGRPIPRDMIGQLNAGPRVNRDQLQPGDIIYFQNTYMAGMSHDGIYIGGGRFINARNENVGVIIGELSDPFWNTRWYAANRP